MKDTLEKRRAVVSSRLVRITFRHIGRVRGEEYEAKRNGSPCARIVRLAGRNPDYYYIYSLTTDIRFNTAGQIGMLLEDAQAFVRRAFNPNAQGQTTAPQDSKS
jgi:hypothetical protein